MSAPALRVLVCDDHPIVRQGLRTFLSSRPGLEVVGEAADGAEAQRKARHLAPDVVLMDLVMPGVGGVEATAGIVAERPGTKVLVLTSFLEDEAVLDAVRAGAVGYLLKDAEPDALEAAVRAAHRGEALLDPRVAPTVLREAAKARAAAPPPALAALTVREREVLGLLGRGLTNRRIARELGVAEKTVKTHVSNVLAKLGVRDRTQAAVLAVREGLAGDGS
jgi:two-component system, NarL family, response regulator LiaR